MAVLRPCKQHGKKCFFCTAHKKAARGGGPCGSHIPEHAKVCKLHGGRSPNAQKAQTEREQTAAIARLIDRLGVEVETTPEEALLHQVWEAAGNVEMYRQLVAQLALHPTEETIEDFDEDGNPIRYAVTTGQSSIYGRTGNEKIINEAAPHVLVRMYDAERDRLSRIAKACAEVGISERLIRIAEQQAELMVKVFTAAVEDDTWKLTKAQREAGRNVFARHLRLVAS